MVYRAGGQSPPDPTIGKHHTPHHFVNKPSVGWIVVIMRHVKIRDARGFQTATRPPARSPRSGPSGESGGSPLGEGSRAERREEAEAP